MDCYSQVCDKSKDLCGSSKLHQLFSVVIETLGTHNLDYFQHKSSSYEKSDGSKVKYLTTQCFLCLAIIQGQKWELLLQQGDLSSIVQLLDDKLFGKEAGEPFIIHCLKKLLANEARHNLRTNIKPKDVIIYSDYSKGP